MRLKNGTNLFQSHDTIRHEVKDMENIEKMIDEKKKQMVESLKKGNSVEIHASKDGIKVYEVKKKKI